jgi:hypothetical protein
MKSKASLLSELMVTGFESFNWYPNIVPWRDFDSIRLYRWNLKLSVFSFSLILVWLVSLFIKNGWSAAYNTDHPMTSQAPHSWTRCKKMFLQKCFYGPRRFAFLFRFRKPQSAGSDSSAAIKPPYKYRRLYINYTEGSVEPWMFFKLRRS